MSRLLQSVYTLYAALIAVIMVAGMSMAYVTKVFEDHRQPNYPASYISEQVNQILVAAKSLKSEALQRHIPGFQQANIMVSLSPQSAKNYFVVKKIDARLIHNMIINKPYHIKLTMEISKQQWINVRTHPSHVAPSDLRYKHGYYAAILLLACLLACLIFRRLTSPLRELTRAAEAFARQLQPQNVVETSNEHINAAIHAFNKIQFKIKKILTDRTTMLAAISHDLRTPLTRLQLRLETLEGQAVAEKMQADINHMNDMIASFIVYAGHDYQQEAIEKIDINALLDSVCADRHDVGKAVYYHEPSQPIYYSGRMSSLQRAFSNVIDNAIKYGLSVDVFLKQQGRQIMITIEDRGPGIAQADFDKVFLPFYRTNKARSSDDPGSGLGLSIVKDIITLHHGQIVLSNISSSGGLRVLITL